ncbi:hypothetical protein QFC20_001478 [Naganishia adeliensis]|uniref:Uncharacterized protein n=2 Tax=Naganishia adeliensis TaxID=92952 RepID=A0ACC2WRU5_9TREE|nr:hypothetical protein QFC20_006666 [Naganishia adeliensis]KAJ9114337.1 hypothetical protein QFC20_001478 [Naganishia adeliensis]
MSDPIALYGLTAIPADQSKLKPATTTPQPVPVAELKPPSTAFCSRIDTYTRENLSEDTYRHSLRVYSYGVAIARECFPQWGLGKDGKLDETWFAYEFWAGYLALDLLQKGEEGAVATKDQAESVAEAIIRHQDVQPVGNISLLTGLIHFGTLLDNIGVGSHLIHENTVANVVSEYPRKGWSGCFKDTVETEKKLKPWAMVSRIDGFEAKIEENGRGGVTGKYD